MEAKNISFSLRDYSVALVILCGGLATRLKGYLDANMSKAMIDIEERPYLLQIVEEAHSLGIDVVLASGAHTKDINNFFSNDRWIEKRVFLSIEPEPLGTAGAIRKIATDYGYKILVVMNGDTVLHAINLLDVIRCHKKKQMAVTQVVTKGKSNQNHGLIFAGNGKVQYSFEREELLQKEVKKSSYKLTKLSSTGLYVINACVAKEWPDGYLSLEKSILPKMIDTKSVGAYTVKSTVYDFGTPSRLNGLSTVKLIDIFIK